MNELNTKANGAKKVTPATATETNTKPQNAKNEQMNLILESKAEKRLKNFDNFQHLCKKFTFLKMKSDDLNAYLVGRDGLKETMTITNTDGKIFEISNSRILSKILEMCQDELFSLLDECEKEVINFDI